MIYFQNVCWLKATNLCELLNYDSPRNGVDHLLKESTITILDILSSCLNSADQSLLKDTEKNTIKKLEQMHPKNNLHK